MNRGFIYDAIELFLGIIFVIPVFIIFFTIFLFSILLLFNS